MTPLERLATVAAGGTPDCIPLFCNLIDQGAQELGMSPKEYFSDGSHVAEAQLKMLKRFGHDNLWSLFYVGKEAELLGCRHIIYADNGPPNVGHLVLKTYDDIHDLQIPDNIVDHPAFAETRKCLRILRRETGGRYPVCAYLTASMTLPAILMGMEKWIELLFTGPPEVRDELLEKCSLFFRRQAAAYRAEGADILVYSNPFGSTDVVPLTFFENLSLPWMKRDLEEGGTAGIVYYCGGARMNSVLERVITETGIATYYLSPMDAISEGKRIIAGRALCAGVINDIRLVARAPQQVREEVRTMLKAGMPGGRFFFGTLVMPLAIPEANIRAMIDAVREFGSSPW
ncbi:MAG: uroporphyrinogen decarboxylase family protein [Desulfuromonadaceae bacterium]|nr:uroporphyrinogen decarboxylase family protein [Desulfuromonadaceae bacterium]MDD5105554.1 uroporphyrinogen decarboxylase family protein [Desulfuromonadaceae bacterium]